MYMYERCVFISPEQWSTNSMDYYEDDYCQFLDETYPQYETEQISTEGGYADYE